MRYLKSVFLFFFLFSCSVAIADELSDLQAKAESGDADAQYQLGTLYYDKGYNKDVTEDFINAGVSEDYKQAAHWYLKAAEQGDDGGQHLLGTLYYNGEGVPQDFKLAEHWFLKAAEQGDDAYSAGYLGDMYIEQQVSNKTIKKPNIGV